MEAVDLSERKRLMNSNVKGVSLNFVDTETTGVSSKDRIVEICVRKCKRGELEREFHTFVNPKRAITPDARRVNRISKEELRHSPTFRDIAGNLVEFIGNDPIVGHNANFDSRMISNELKRSNSRVPQNVKRVLSHPIDTKKIHTRLHRHKDHKLESVAKEYGFKQTEAHRARPDARMTEKVFYRMAEEFRKKTRLSKVTLADLQEYQDT